VKLLFDQNVSFRLIKLISNSFDNSAQVRELGLENKTDLEIWQFAKDQGYTIVTFDADFYELSNLFGHPPKIIWLRIGNSSTNELSKFLLDRAELINSFLTESDYYDIACLELG
jgi:predicted nuclease of predicted toxin-antitoxin system